MCNNKFGQYVLLVLLTIFVSLEIKAILSPRIVNVYTSAVEVKAHTEADISQTGEQSPIEDIPTMIQRYFPEDSKTAINLFQKESGLDPNCSSNTDIMPDGRPFSWGLAQINLTVHSIGSVECHKAFRGTNYKAVVIDEGLYLKCVELAKNPQIALEKAREIYNSRGFYAWGAFKLL
jgi:hypothetical protein